MSWDPPWDTTGTHTHIRVSASVAGTDVSRACLDNVALKSHPEVMVQPWVDRRYARYNTFPLGLLRDAVIALNNGDIPPDENASYSELARRAVAWLIATGDTRGEVHPAAARWLSACLENYLETAEALAAADQLQPGPSEGWRILATVGEEQTEMPVWGVHYATADGLLRETWLLRTRELASAPPPRPATVAAAAFITAFGIRTVPGDKFSHPHSPASPPDPTPARVRVREVSVSDGSDRLVFDDTPEQARDMWRPHQAAARALTEGGDLRTCQACDSCAARHVCTELPSDPGLLGLPSFGHHPRRLAPTALTTYRMCPAKYLLTKIIQLPPTEQHTSLAMRRGLAAHQWLETAHRRGVACSAADLPNVDVARAPSLGAVADEVGLSAEDYSDVRPYLLQHLQICPLTRDSAGIWPEVDVVVHDPDADVTVSSRADLLLARDGHAVWRETKTVTQQPDASDEDLLNGFPQIAVAVCAVADDKLGHRALAAAATGQHLPPGSVDAALATGMAPAPLPPGIVELELLSPETARLVTYDTADERTIMLARRAIAMAAHDWHRDDEFVATPGAHCAACEVATWCPAAFAAPAQATVAIDGVVVDAATGEIVDAPRAQAPSATQVASILDLIANPVDADDDEPAPF